MLKNKQKILLIEDEKSVAKAYSEYLEKRGYQMEIAYDGEEGLSKVKKFEPDLILLDILMPIMDGISVLKELKADQTIKEIPVVILTNIDTNEKVAEALKAGSTHYLVKLDYSLEELEKRIKEVLNHTKIN